VILRGHRRFGVLVLALSLLARVAVAQSVVVQTLDGRSGKPVKKGTVIQVAFPDEAVHRLLGLHTDRLGEVEFDTEGAKDFQVGAVGYISCREGSSQAQPEKYSVEEVLQSGIVGPNHCGQAITQPQAGRLILYVKPEGLWDKVKNSG
jgi:hypothetical protein